MHPPPLETLWVRYASSESGGFATNNTGETEPSEIYFQNGSDHTVVGSYSELYEEGEVEHINSPSLPPGIGNKMYEKNGILRGANTKTKEVGARGFLWFT